VIRTSTAYSTEQLWLGCGQSYFSGHFRKRLPVQRTGVEYDGVRDRVAYVMNMIF
jgi:hypothetical protein